MPTPPRPSRPLPPAHPRVLLRQGQWRWLCVLLWVAALLAGPARAAELVLDHQRSAHPAWPAVTVLSELGQSLSLADVRRRVADFTVPDTPEANLGPRPEAVWLRLPVRVPVQAAGTPGSSHDGRWVFDIDYPPLNRVDLYLVTDGRLALQRRLGASQPFSERPMATRTHALELVLAPGVLHEVYLRVQTESATVLPMHFSTPDHFRVREARTQTMQGLMAGVALALLVYSLGHWLSLRNSLFGLYALMMLASGMFLLQLYGLLQQHLVEELVGVAARIAPISVLLAMVAGSLFVVRALETGRYSPLLHRGLLAVAWLSGGGMLLCLAGVLDYRSAQTEATILGPLLMVLAVPATWAAMRRGEPAGLYMLVGWTSYAIGALAMSGLMRGLLPANGWTLHLFQMGWLIEVLLWLRVLGLHIEAVRSAAERTEVERRTLARLAATDALTGLPNRRGLDTALAAALATARSDRALAVYLLDLDGFKQVNDRLGHDAGDALLVQVARRLTTQLRHRDVVARLGGDEFVIVASDLCGDAEAMAQGIGRKLLDAFREPFDIEGQRCAVGLTIGFAMAPHDGLDGADLLKRADAAMYSGKQAGRHCLRRGGATAALAGV